MLDNARASRNDVDYGIRSSYSINEAKKDICVCRKIIGEISRLGVAKVAEA